jgi:hypothetical protein
MSHFFGSDRVRPRITKAKLRGGFLGDDFGGRCEDRAKWVTQLAGVFPVGVVDAPELLAGLQSRARSHGSSSPQALFAKMYLIHKMHGQSAGSPMNGHGKDKVDAASKWRFIHCSNAKGFVMLGITMIIFPAIALLGLSVIAVWAWSRWRRRGKNTAVLTVPATVSPDTVKEKAVEPTGPEVASDFAAPISPEPQPILLELGNTISEQPAETSPTNLPPEAATAVDPIVSHTEQPGAQEIVVPAELNVKEKTETTTFHAENVPKTSVPLAMPPEADSSPHEWSVHTDTVANSPPESAITPTVKEEEPSVETPQQAPTEADIVPRPPTYRPTAPATPRPRRPTNTRPKQSTNADLRLRVQLVFGRGGVVRNLALAPDRRDGMPSEIEIRGTQGELHLTELRDDCYEPLMLADASNALLQGVEWRGRVDAQHWRWVLGGRELYVLAPGDEFGLHGFVSTAHLWLNARHVVLATKRLREEVLSALADAGCATPEIADDTTLGVPSGWLLFRDVIPTRAVPMRDDHVILNSLCPAHEIEPHFAGGIRLERTTWLAGFPPRIRFTGEFANGFQVKIDGHPAHPANDGGFEVPGWDSEGEHRLWFGDRAETYSLCTMGEAWEHWHAHDFGTGAAICGASTYQLDATQRRQVRVPVSNLLLIGARPGEIFHCQARSDVRCETVLAMVSFMPVWALPLDPAHADKESTRIFLFHPSEPLADIQIPAGNRTATNKLRVWISAIREAGCKGLVLDPADEQTKALWRRYRVMAKKLRRRMR